MRRLLAFIFLAFIAYWIVKIAIYAEVRNEHPKSRWFHEVLVKMLGHPGTTYSDVRLDLVFEGKELHLERHIACLPIFGGTGMYNGGLQFSYIPQWIQESRAITQKLPDNRGIIFPLPDVCQSSWSLLGRKDLYSRYSIENYIPPLYVVDDINHPSVIQGYFNLSQLTSASSDIRIKNFQASLAQPSKAHSITNEGEFACLVSGYNCTSKPINFYVRTARIIGPIQWRQFPGLIEAFSHLTQATDLSADRASKILGDENARLINSSWRRPPVYSLLHEHSFSNAMEYINLLDDGPRKLFSDPPIFLTAKNGRWGFPSEKYKTISFFNPNLLEPTIQLNRLGNGLFLSSHFTKSNDAIYTAFVYFDPAYEEIYFLEGFSISIIPLTKTTP